MLLNKYRWIIPLCVSLLVVMACGQISLGVITPTAANAPSETPATGILDLSTVSTTSTPTVAKVEPPQMAVADVFTPTPQVLESTPVQTSVNDTAKLFSSYSGQLDICFSYPPGYTQNPDIDTVDIAAPDLPGTDTKGRFWLEVSDFYGLTAEEIADQEVTYAYATGVDVVRWTETLDGEQAVVLDGMSGQEFQRRVYVMHQQTLYVLAFWPARSENKAAATQMETLYAAVINSWTWSPCSAGK